MDSKICTKCKVDKPVGDFQKNRSFKDGLDYWCKGCLRIYIEANEDIQRGYKLKWKFGLRLEDYKEMLSAQNGVCAICREPCISGRWLAVDHDRTCCPTQRSCGRCIRGLLCRDCNTSLGKFKNSPDILRRAADYLEQYVPTA